MSGMDGKPAARKPLGEILVASGYLTRPQLDEALSIQRKPGPRRMLGQILISRGFVTKAQIQIALARQKPPGA